MATSEVGLAEPRSHQLLWRRYLELTKPKVLALILFTALVGMLLAVPGMVPLSTLFFGLLGIELSAAAGAAINHVVDQRVDALMDRTRERPLPSGDLDTRHAVAFALGLAVISMLILVVLVNPLTALLTFAAFIGYAVIYTMYLKRATPHNIVWGGISGAMPPLLGWTAVTGEVAVEGLLLALLVFIWTPPHFWALAIKRRDEYARAGIPMLPVTHGLAYTKLQILIYTLLLLWVSLMPFMIHMSGLLYLIGALGLGLGFVYQAVRLFRSQGDALAMQTFNYSILYLSALFAILLADHYLGAA
ncbi:MAG: heme o synthase [Candidatus Thiosymbion ectosymbiont of Robbea hypermnestra]|nr:heme o synthase [Candidatus Thiosymbion ectosymbiont of Robbea hypermnestra]